MRPWRTSPWTWLLAACALLVPQRTLAYCQLTTDAPVRSECPTTCITSGTPLAWKAAATYTFNENFIPSLDEASVRRIFEASFGEWTQTDCMLGPVDLSVTQDTEATSTTETSKNDGTSLIVYRTPEEWKRHHPEARNAFALTIVAYVEGTGRLVGADMELNGGIGTFTECGDDGCVPGSEVDLGNVVTHEAGHFLGMAHSNVETATMYCDARASEIEKRTLDNDDIEGICAVYGAVEPETGGCSAAPGAAPGVSLLSLVCFGAWLVARRRIGGHGLLK